MKKVDVAIIGSGPACLSLAFDLKSAGKTVAVAEENLWGGTCPNRGCDPKKILMAAEEARGKIQHLVGKGFREVPAIDWSELMAFKKTYTDPISPDRIKGFEESGIDHYQGRAVLKDAHTIQIGTEELTAETIILATGQRARLLDIPGKEHFLTSTDFLALAELPKKIVFLGAGYISFELAAIANVCGAEVTIVHHNATPLRGFDQELAEKLVTQLQAAGIHFRYNEQTESLEKTATGFRLKTDQATYEVGAVVCATGRIANVDGLGLTALGIEHSAKGVVVDEYLRTTQPHIFAMGDCIAKKEPKMTPVAGFEGRYLSQYFAGNTEPIHYPQVPTAVFTVPTLAQVGITRQTAEQSEEYTISSVDMTSWYNYFRTNDPAAFATIIKDQAGNIVGAATLNEKADEWINLMTMIINLKVPTEKINQLIMAYPSVGSDLQYY
ncbi:dihydrolipoyl dehydrogenase family protein [Enterococcus canis]|uniref:dihydrolipoyl dehydrogenase family protein n=1 Tax=Enterococcus canis TaxID=214095 RepID=UPI000830172A|nr:NAD(P)/FAD-dependent oxidoreductase [Enterococcus canis]